MNKPAAQRRKRPYLIRDEQRYRLLYGPYEPPLVKRGFLVDALRGKVPFGTFSNALISWPKARRRGRGGSGGLVLCGDLLRALQTESCPAICHYWGVSRATVGNWRRALQMKGITAGAERLVKLGVEIAKRPECRQKISEAALGRALAPVHRAKLLRGINQGWKARFKARRAAFRLTGSFPKATQSDPWIPEEERLLSKLPTAELVPMIGRSASSIHAHRKLLGIRTHAPVVQRAWSEREIALLGTDLDRAIAQRLSRTVHSVEKRRQALGIKRFNFHPWTAREEALVGRVSDAEAARRLGRSEKAIQQRRLALGRGFFQRKNRRG